MDKLKEHLVSVILVLLMMGAQGCATAGPPIPPVGMIYEIHPGSTMLGISQAIFGKPGTVILMHPEGKIALAGWSFPGGGYGMACLEGPCSNPQGLIRWLGGKGMLVKVEDFSSLVKFLRERGWQVIGGSAARTQAAAAVVQSWMAQAATIMPTILVLPAWVQPPSYARPMEEGGGLQ